MTDCDQATLYSYTECTQAHPNNNSINNLPVTYTESYVRIYPSDTPCLSHPGVTGALFDLPHF